MRQSKRDDSIRLRNNHARQNKRIRLYKGFFRLDILFSSRIALRAVRYGKRKNQNNNQNICNESMSKLRESVLAFAQSIGDKSGCHQLSERSFHIRGYTFPVCARCTGVFAGQIAAVILLVFGLRCPWYISVSLLSLMGLDWLIQHLDIKQSTNRRRLLTGIGGGFGLFSIYIDLFELLYHLIVSLF